MTRLAIIDVDGIIANVDARFAKAEEARNAYLRSQQGIPDGFSKSNIAHATDLYWRTVFTPELVSLDTLIDGVNDALLDIQVQGYKVVLLTSRPDSMRSATMHWLLDNGLWDRYNDLVMKAPAFQYTKTTVWKAGIVQTLEAFYAATDLLIVDDEQANINEHLKYFSNVQTRELCKSLAEAVAKLNGTWVEPDPFMPAE